MASDGISGTIHQEPVFYTGVFELLDNYQVQINFGVGIIQPSSLPKRDCEFNLNAVKGSRRIIRYFPVMIWWPDTTNAQRALMGS